MIWIDILLIVDTLVPYRFINIERPYPKLSKIIIISKISSLRNKKEIFTLVNIIPSNSAHGIYAMLISN